MKFRATILILCAVLVGCKKDQHLVAVMTDNPSVEKPHDWIAEMKALAKEHHMRYRIICRDSISPSFAYLAILESGTWGTDPDDEIWVGGFGETQELAAKDLITIFGRDGFVLPHPKSARALVTKHRQCAKPIQGEEFVQKVKPWGVMDGGGGDPKKKTGVILLPKEKP